MRLITGKRIGQSGNEFTTAVFFSLFIHVIMFFGVFYLSHQIRQRTFSPPYYRVNLVDLPSDLPMMPSAAPMEAPPAAPPAAAAGKSKSAAPKAKTIARPAAVPKTTPAQKAAMPELDGGKKTTDVASQQKQETAGKRQEAVSMQAPVEFAPGSAFEWYSNNVRMKIKGNWKYEYSPKNASATVVFTILRSGIAQQVKLERASGIFSFDQAAMRAIQLSSPFPALPEEFSQQSAVFVVDLQPEE